MERQFFSGNTIEQAVLAAARHFGLDPDRIAYSVRDKKHGFVNIRRRVVIEVDPSAPEQPENVVAEPAAPAEASPPIRPARPEPRAPEVGSWNEIEPQDRSLDVAGDRESAAIGKAVEALIQLMDLRLEASVEQDDEGFEIELSGLDKDALMEMDGRLLRSIEHLLPRLARSFLGHGVSCRVDCEGFRAAHEEELQELAREVADEVERDEEEQILEPMNPADRRVVHMELAEDPAVRTVSEGEGFLKRVRIVPR